MPASPVLNVDDSIFDDCGCGSSRCGLGFDGGPWWRRAGRAVPTFLETLSELQSEGLHFTRKLSSNPDGPVAMGDYGFFFRLVIADSLEIESRL
ncbi:hypothetical protein HanHA300_Chr07g0252851 [Helianthus annuus]|nr:hypothetical protein HanHA300_Chr07g0252851 [Helianthus annuus]KAJ0729357.1 hypothetical protein HanLR1_Chr07g0252001 [Helianthus annuus]